MLCSLLHDSSQFIRSKFLANNSLAVMVGKGAGKLSETIRTPRRTITANKFHGFILLLPAENDAEEETSRTAAICKESSPASRRNLEIATDYQFQRNASHADDQSISLSRELHSNRQPMHISVTTAKPSVDAGLYTRDSKEMFETNNTSSVVLYSSILT